jgi:predicted GNAT family acetyltransferase
MNEVKLLLEDDGNGMFYIMEEGESLAEMRVKVQEKIITASHTEVLPKAEGKGLGKLLFEELVKYTREKGLTLNPLCPFVHARLKKSAAEYADIWKN